MNRLHEAGLPRDMINGIGISPQHDGCTTIIEELLAKYQSLKDRYTLVESRNNSLTQQMTELQDQIRDMSRDWRNEEDRPYKRRITSQPPSQLK